MQVVSCQIHNLTFSLPETKEEILEEKYHIEVQRCEEHRNESPECKLENASGVEENIGTCKCGHVREYHSSKGCFSSHCPCRLDNKGGET